MPLSGQSSLFCDTALILCHLCSQLPLIAKTTYSLITLTHSLFLSLLFVFVSRVVDHYRSLSFSLILSFLSPSFSFFRLLTPHLHDRLVKGYPALLFPFLLVFRYLTETHGQHTPSSLFSFILPHLFLFSLSQPAALCDRLITVHSRPGDTVLIPFGGSGSECVSALNSGRRFLACEKEPMYFDMMRHRLTAAVMGEFIALLMWVVFASLCVFLLLVCVLKR